MAGTSTERVRIANESGSNVADVDSKGVKKGLATYLLDSNGAHIEAFDGSNYTILTTDNADNKIEYAGWAVPGSDTALGRGSSIWQIAKVTYTAGGNPLLAWAEGVDTFTNEWDSRDQYTYS